VKARPRKQDRTEAAVAAIAAVLFVLAFLFGAQPGAPVAAGELSAPAVPDRLAEHLARRYRISAEAAEATIGAAYRAADENGLDPLLVLAVIGVESSFNPAAESHKGAKGLMQIVPRYHLATLTEYGGEALVHEPHVNVTVGARILVEYIERNGGVEAGLQRYNGAAKDAEARYAQRVIAERDRLQGVLAAARND
jgi:soluble lytic murein transglycosylase-like protein